MTTLPSLSCLADASALILSRMESTTRKRKRLDDCSHQPAEGKRRKKVSFCSGDTIIQSPLTNSEVELLPTLCWSGEEIRQNLRQNMQLLSHELKHRGGDHILYAVMNLYKESSKVIQADGLIVSSQSCKILLDLSSSGDSDIRGLERHHPSFKILMTENRVKHATRILKLQRHLVDIKHEFKERMLRSLSAKSSRGSRVMARIMAQHDSNQVVSMVRQELERLVSGPRNENDGLPTGCIISVGIVGDL